MNCSYCGRKVKQAYKGTCNNKGCPGPSIKTTGNYMVIQCYLHGNNPQTAYGPYSLDEANKNQEKFTRIYTNQGSQYNFFVIPIDRTNPLLFGN